MFYNPAVRRVESTFIFNQKKKKILNSKTSKKALGLKPTEADFFKNCNYGNDFTNYRATAKELLRVNQNTVF